MEEALPLAENTVGKGEVELVDVGEGELVEDAAADADALALALPVPLAVGTPLPELVPLPVGLALANGTGVAKKSMDAGVRFVAPW